MLEISSSVSFKKSVICVAIMVMSEGAAGIGRADSLVDGSSLAMLRSKIGVSKSSSSAGLTSTSMGHSSSSSAPEQIADIRSRIAGERWFAFGDAIHPIGKNVARISGVIGWAWRSSKSLTEVYSSAEHGDARSAANGI
uniref:Uncharacterized protein n=1 Tax=Romanomermis culicivorax TaxID=13658 RepID=A0A915HMD3_ROMCU